MPAITETVVVDAPPREAWNYLTDMDNFASHLPGFQDREEVDDLVSYWTVKIDLSMFTKELTFEVEVLEESFPRAEFTLDPQDQPATGSGSVEFAEADESGGTAITVEFDSEAEGRMAPFLNTVIEKALERVGEAFVEDLADSPIAEGDIRRAE